MIKLISLGEFVWNTEACVRESGNTQRGFNLICKYNDFLAQPIKEDMFNSENPLFDGFVKSSQGDAMNNKIKKSYDNFGNDEFMVTIRNEESRSWSAHYHLKIISDLIGKVQSFNPGHNIYGIESW